MVMPYIPSEREQELLDAYANAMAKPVTGFDGIAEPHLQALQYGSGARLRCQCHRAPQRWRVKRPSPRPALGLRAPQLSWMAPLSP